MPGDPSSAQHWGQSGRAKTFSVIFGPGPAERFDVALEEEPGARVDHRRPFWVPLPHPVLSSCVTIVPRETIRATSGGAATLAWAEITLFTDFDGPEGVARLIKTLDGADCASRVDDVVALGRPAGAPLVSQLGASAAPSANGRRCLLDALARLAGAEPGLGPEAASGLQGALPEILTLELDAEDERLLGQIVSHLVPPPVPPLREVLGNPARSEGARGRAARLLAGLDDAAAGSAILEAVGSEPGALRAQLRRLAAADRGGTAALRAAIIATPAAAAGRRADLTFALGTAAATTRTPQAEDRIDAGASSTLVAELALDQRADFEVRARAIQALAAIADDRGVEALARLSQKGDPAPLRLLATQGLGRVGRAGVLPALRAALDDGDPAVREAAVGALGALRDKGANPLLIAGAKQEPWPMVRRAEIAALGRVCGPGSGDLLIRAVERDVLDVRKVALAGLSACRDPRAQDLLLTLLRREPEAPPLRTQAALLLGQAGDRAATPALAAALKRMVVQSQDDLAVEESALTTVDALARLGGPAAQEAILALRTDPRPSFRRAAVQGLGRLCEAPQSAAALQEASRDADAAVVAAARASLRRCSGARPEGKAAVPRAKDAKDKPDR